MYEALLEILKGFENTNIEEFEMVTSNAIHALKNIGLTNAEARAYVFLFVAGYGTVELIAGMAGLPRTSAYRIFRRLEQKALVKAIGEEPKIYRVVQPEIIVTNLAWKIAAAFEALEKYRIGMEYGHHRVVEKVRREDFEKKLSILVDTSEKELLISTHELSRLWKVGARAIINAKAKNLRIVIRARKGMDLEGIDLDGIKCIFDENVVTTEIISDRKAMLFTKNWKEFYFTTQPEFIAHVIAGWKE